MANKGTVIIIGATGTIGSSIAYELNEQDYKCHLISREEEGLKKISNEIGCKYTIADVLKVEDFKQKLSEIDQNISGLAYCAGSINLKPIVLAKEEEYLESFKLNTLGAIISIKSFIQSLEKNNGSILLFSTIAVKQGFKNHTIVSSAKGAIEALTLSLAAEFASKIRVNCIAPSITDSKMTKNIISNENIRKAICNMHPMPKIGEGQDFAKLAAFLLGNYNTWITGQVIGIDGGRSTLRIKA